MASAAIPRRPSRVTNDRFEVLIISGGVIEFIEPSVDDRHYATFARCKAMPESQSSANMSPPLGRLVRAAAARRGLVPVPL